MPPVSQVKSSRTGRFRGRIRASAGRGSVAESREAEMPRPAWRFGRAQEREQASYAEPQRPRGRRSGPDAASRRGGRGSTPSTYTSTTSGTCEV